jgi:hypothetical protein
MRLADIVERVAPELLQRHGGRLTADMRRALRCWRHCRGPQSPHVACHCAACQASASLPQACGHRACPHCQHDLGNDWLAQQRALRLPVDYFLLTFTLPAQLRALARRHPRVVHAALMQCAWQTLQAFARRGRAVDLGATAVLHTHSRRRDYHPHVHLVVPGGGVNPTTGRWNQKRRYLFNSRNLARVFRAKLLQRLRDLQLTVPADLPQDWVAHCACVGDGEKALAYLARYLYRGVLSEHDLLDVTDGQVRFRYRDAMTRQNQTRTLPGADFLWLLLTHVLPKGFRRSRNYGLLHHRRQALLRRVQLMLRVTIAPAQPRTRRPVLCWRCGQPMRLRVVHRSEQPRTVHASDAATTRVQETGAV